MLRGFGNSLVAPAAEAFVRAYMNVMGEDLVMLPDDIKVHTAFSELAVVPIMPATVNAYLHEQGQEKITYSRFNLAAVTHGEIMGVISVTDFWTRERGNLALQILRLHGSDEARFVLVEHCKAACQAMGYTTLWIGDQQL